MLNVEINNYVDAHLSEMVGTLSKIIAIPSVRGKAVAGKPYGEECAAVLDKMLSIAEGFGFTVANHKYRVGTIDLYPAVPPTLGILCHLDVVPAGEGWRSPPYSLMLSNGKLWGRGASDDKGPAMCVLYAMKAIRECRIPLTKNVRFIVGTDEENGSSDIAWYKSQFRLPPNVFTPDGSYPVINIEKGMIRFEFSSACMTDGEKSVISARGGTVINAVPESASADVRGFTQVEIALAAKTAGVTDMLTITKTGELMRLEISGKSAHASNPAEGKNAVTALCALLGRLVSSDSSTEMFRSLSLLFPFGETDGTSLKINCADEKSGVLTEVFSLLDFSSGKLTGKADIRFPLCSSVEIIKEKLEKALAAKNVALSGFSGVAPHEVDSGSAFVRTLSSVYEDVTGARGGCVAIGGGTYVHEIDGGVAFGAEFPGDNNHIHSANEFISLERLKVNTKIFAEAIIRLCK